MSDERSIVESGIEARIASIIEPEIEDLGYRLVRVKMTAVNGSTLQIMAERSDGTMNVEGCEEISRAISPVLDIEDPVNHAYHLEVSSPGIDRPLVRRSDFNDWSGYIAKLETLQMIKGRKRYKGVIIGIDGDEITFRREDPSADESPEFVIPITEIKDAKLVMTDDLITEALRRDKALRQANGLSSEDDQEPTKH